MKDVLFLASINVLAFTATYVFIRYGWLSLHARYKREESHYEQVLNRQLLMNISPRFAMGIVGLVVIGTIVVVYSLFGSLFIAMIFAVMTLFLPGLVLRYLARKRREALERQLVDTIMTLASGVRAGLTLVQSMDLLVKNMPRPTREEFGQLLREYHMGLDLHHAMHNAADRIGSSHFRLLFTAMEMHRIRGGDTGESLDRIAESIREIQRLEGKLDALTSQGRSQAWMLAAMPPFVLMMYYLIDRKGVEMLFTEVSGRIVLAIAIVMITAGFFWIRRIMTIDI